MRQRVVEVPLNLAPPEWVDDPQFDLDYHLRSLAVPSPGNLDELLAEVSPLFATPLDRSRPLWEAYVAEGLSIGRGALFVKMHHCLMDGVGGVRVLAGLFSERSSAAPRATDEPPEPSHEPPDAGRSIAPAAMLCRAQRHNLGVAATAAARLSRSALGALLDPLAAVDGLWKGMRAASGFGRELVMSRARSPLHAERSKSRRLATFEIPLADIEAICRRFGVTNNDVVLTVVSGAMHRWHTSRGADVKELRATVPVNLRAADDTSGGNRIALLAVRLPIGEPNPLTRLGLIHEGMSSLKQDRRAALYPILAQLMLAMPAAISSELGRQQTYRTNFVCTNVPGPRHTCYLAGEAITSIYAYAPLVGDHPVAIALLSYRDTVFVGLDVDPLAMPDLAHFIDALGESLAELLALGHEPGATIERRAAI